MYCSPVNCYCAEVLGDLNQLNLKNKTYYIRPENIFVSKKSAYKLVWSNLNFLEKNIK